MGDKGLRSCGLDCARRIRGRVVRQLRDGEGLRVELLHTIAEEIVGHCGHTAFKSHRLAWGWTVTEAVEQFHQMCRHENIKPRGLVTRSWMEWEAGSRPNWDYQNLLSKLFHTNPVHLGWAPDYAPTVRTVAAPGVTHQVAVEHRVEKDDDMRRRQLLIGGTVAGLTLTHQRFPTRIGMAETEHLAGKVGSYVTAEQKVGGGYAGQRRSN